MTMPIGNTTRTSGVTSSPEMAGLRDGATVVAAYVPFALALGAARVLRPHGRMVFSVPHPCTDTPLREWERDADGRKISLKIDRYFDTGDGRAELRPWSGEYADYRAVAGLLVPHRFVGYWHVDGQRIPYVDFLLEPPEYDAKAPF